MKKRIFAIVFAVTMLLIFLQAAFAQDLCTPDARKGCIGSTAWWYDSCGNPSRVDRYCNYNEDCVDGNCVVRCGNGRCDSEENCGICSQDCRCADYEQCSWNTCQTYCGNGRCDGSETCSSCTQDCSCSQYEKCSYNGRCETYCGNGKCEGNENCNSCFQDCGCGKSEECAPGGPRAD
ncbi:MAG: hypothetical protein V1906_01910 [Candidatus Woesearchaeota archaeon]